MYMYIYPPLNGGRLFYNKQNGLHQCVLLHMYSVCTGGVPDKLCEFPADESYIVTSSKQPLSRDRWLVWPHHDHVHVCTDRVVFDCQTSLSFIGNPLNNVLSPGGKDTE